VHKFTTGWPDSSKKFDTVISLAVIEHVTDPAGFLHKLANYHEDSTSARLIITTPHPSEDCVHDVGAALGLFSNHANEEHEDLLNYSKLRSAGTQARLKLVSYKRFLLGANQIAVFKKSSE